MYYAPNYSKVNDFYVNYQSGLKKISDAPRPCLSGEHNPPSMIVLQPGTYEYTCPMCGYKTTFSVHATTC